jgi:tight adherence protein C
VGTLARATAGRQERGPATVEQINRYGFTRRRSDAAREAIGSAFEQAAERLGTAFSRRFGHDSSDDLRRELAAAGLYRLRPGHIIGYRVLAAIVLPLIWIWFANSLKLNIIIGFVGTVFCAYGGWVMPLRFVRERAKRRLDEIDYELPELIDLLIVTVEAGLGFVGSLQTASNRLEGPLGNELRLTLQEQNMGLSINEALMNMLARCDTPSMRSFVRSITQGETLGVSIGQIMRDLAGEMRRRRRASAQERAQKAPIKILFPLVFLIFPAMFVILLGPAIFQFFKAIHGSP